MHRHPASQKNTWRKVDVISNPTVVLDHGGCVHNAVLSDPSTRIDRDVRHDDGPFLKPGRLRYHRRRVDECGRQQAAIEGSLKACGPQFVFPYGYQILRTTLALQRLQIPASSADLAAAEFAARYLLGIVDE
jgi:hypothetical protein